ncbi:MAG: transcription-repair coupling factor [Gemmatimonadota bacterium]
MRSTPSTRLHRIVEAAAACPALRTVAAQTPAPGERIVLGGVLGSAAAAVVATLATRGAPLLIVTDTPSEAVDFEADLEVLLGPEGAHLFPQRESLPYEAAEPHVEVAGLRIEAVEALLAGRTHVLVTTRRALQERSPLPQRLSDLTLDLEVGMTLPFRALTDALTALGFERVPLVEEVGQFAVRGGLVDVFSFGSPEPVRVEFWGDEVESIRAFDILDQRTQGERTDARILPLDFRPRADRTTTADLSLFDIVPDGTVVVDVTQHPWEPEAERVWSQVLRLREEAVEAGLQPAPPDTVMIPPADFLMQAQRWGTLRLQSEGTRCDAVLNALPAPAVDRDMKRLKRLLEDGAGLGLETLLLCDNEGQAERLEEILGGAGSLPPGTTVVVGSLARGFELLCAEPPLRVLTDHEIFRRSRRVRRGRRFRGAVALESLAQLSPGDYVVHMDHGIGRFRGLETVTVGDEALEVLLVEYAGNETLRVPVYRIDLLERWVGASEEGPAPALHRIGGKRWKGLKARTEAAIQKMAQELVELYASRATATGHAFPADTQWQREMESSFLYEDTPDQRQATLDVKADMESGRPMDRLVCGDVGYGKTEVAVRAAFKAVQDGKQVAVLAPTTILVEQHRHTFEERLADYPVRVGALSRFRPAAEQNALLEHLASGELDVVIGTHRLLSRDVRFRALGLLIVDEEQRFGVKHKERLKELKHSVDVLTLTATPIPRTLHLALSGLRDLSLIRTPPRDRMPIITTVLPWRDPVLADAIRRELDRGGQVYFLHNRVETIHTAAERVRQLAPDARTAVAHGQMRPGELDHVMRDFVEGDIDVLVCSSIIENGLDVPNANTLIVDDADRFGLSQLYQIRGRVGRSDRRAFCYLVVPERITDDAEKRLQVLEHYTELGSGYSVALKDLELRGAGNLLGADQSGFAQAVGLDTYLRLLKDTIERMQRPDSRPDFPDPEIVMDGPALIPDDYISDAGQKLHFYRRIAGTSTLADVTALDEELVDRYGGLPTATRRLLDHERLRILGGPLGVERVFLRPQEARLNFREGAHPRMAALAGPLGNRQVTVEVRRMAPLSLVLRREGSDSLAATAIEALTVLREDDALLEAADR